MAVELRNSLTRSIGHSLPVTVLFDHPSLDALANFLMRCLALQPEAARSAAATPPTSVIADEVAQLSDAQAEALLLAELDGTAPRTT
jgi:hypothetical protein